MHGLGNEMYETKQMRDQSSVKGLFKRRCTLNIKM